MKHPTFRSLDHIAILVDDTETALKIWRDRVGLEVLFSEVVNQQTIRLTHLDLGNAHLQLVEPLVADHPLKQWLEAHGPGLHHFCLTVDDIDQAAGDLADQALPTSDPPHQATRGQRALMIERSQTGGIQVEVSGP